MSAAAGTTDTSSPSRRRLLVAAVVGSAAFAAVAFALWAADGDEPAPGVSLTAEPVAAPAAVTPVPARIVTVRQLRELARTGAGPLYWAGVRPGTRLEYTQTENGSRYVRYLTGSAPAGSPRGGFVVVATYVQPDALERVSAVAESNGLDVRPLPGLGIAVREPERPQNLFVAYPGQDAQIEVYGPDRATTDRIVFGGRIRALG